MLRTLGIVTLYNPYLRKLASAWIQNVAELRRNGRIGKVLELGEPRFHAVIAALWNAIAALEQVCRSATETAF